MYVQDVFFYDESAEVVMSSLRLGEEHDRLLFLPFAHLPNTSFSLSSSSAMHDSISTITFLHVNLRVYLCMICNSISSLVCTCVPVYLRSYNIHGSAHACILHRIYHICCLLLVHFRTSKVLLMGSFENCRIYV